MSREEDRTEPAQLCDCTDCLTKRVQAAAYLTGWNEAVTACMTEMFKTNHDMTQSLLERIGKLVKE